MALDDSRPTFRTLDLSSQRIFFRLTVTLVSHLPIWILAPMDTSLPPPQSHPHRAHHKPVTAPPKPRDSGTPHHKPVTAPPKPASSPQPQRKPIAKPTKKPTSHVLALVGAICLPVIIIVLIPVLLSPSEEEAVTTPSEESPVAEVATVKNPTPQQSEAEAEASVQTATTVSPTIPENAYTIDFEVFRPAIEARGLDNSLLDNHYFTHMGFKFTSMENPYRPSSQKALRLPVKYTHDPSAPSGEVVSLGFSYISRKMSIERVDEQPFTFVGLRLFAEGFNPNLDGHYLVEGYRNGQLVDSFQQPIGFFAGRDLFEQSFNWGAVDRVVIDLDQRVTTRLPWIISLQVAP